MAKGRGRGPSAKKILAAGLLVSALLAFGPSVLASRPEAPPSVRAAAARSIPHLRWTAAFVLAGSLAAAFAKGRAGGTGIPFYARIRARRRTGPEWGYVYVLSNKAMPGLLKIGFTDRHPKVRAKELRTTGVPEPFEVEFAVRDDFARRIEAQAHRLMEEERIRMDREFARMEIPAAVSLVKRAQAQVRGAMKGR